MKQILVGFAIGLVVVCLWSVLKDIGNRDGFMAAATKLYPDSKIYQCTCLDEFVRVDTNGNVYSFGVWDTSNPRNGWLEKRLFNVGDFHNER